MVTPESEPPSSLRLLQKLACPTRFVRPLLVALAAVVVAASVVILQKTAFRPMTITAYFASATAIYPGDDIRISGVKVGTIKSIEPYGTSVKMTMVVDHGVPVPATAKAVVVAQNLIAARYVQLAPAYVSSGPMMSDGAIIDQQRTAVPVEWDQVKNQLMHLATDLGPGTDAQKTSVGRFIDSAANAMAGHGAQLRETITELSQTGRILADGSGNVADIVKNLQAFVDALHNSNTQIVQFQNRLATVSSVIDGSRSDLDAALRNLSEVVGDVRRFIADNRDGTAEQVQRLANVTQNLVDNKRDLENVLHVAPNAIANGYNIYNPDTGTALGAFAMNNFANPVQLICSSIGAVQNVTSAETGKLCAQYLGPALRLMNFNYLPFPINSYLAKSPNPDNLVYSDPRLAPGGGGGTTPPPDIPPAVSAYTGIGDVPAPSGTASPAGSPGAYVPDGLPAQPSPALFPGAPAPSGLTGQGAAAPSPVTIDQMLLPAGPQPQPSEQPPIPGGRP